MSKITLDALRVLEAIERNGSFALAAKELHKVPSALTYTVNHLEEQLAIQIFDRTGHRAKLTTMGKLLVDEGQKLLISATQLEKKIKLQQMGFETELLLAYDQLIPFQQLLPLLQGFYQACPGVAVKISAEVLGGCWDALLSNRAAIVLGVSGEPPIREDIAIQSLCSVQFEFLVGKNHPLAKQSEPLTNEQILTYRSIAVADSTHRRETRTTGILPGQEVLTVNHFHEKIAAMIQGLGIGYLPRGLAMPYIESGELIVKSVARLKAKAQLSLAWRPSLVGKGGRWLIEKLSDKTFTKNLFA